MCPSYSVQHKVPKINRNVCVYIFSSYRAVNNRRMSDSNKGNIGKTSHLIRVRVTVVAVEK
jgi:hypothetical protein